MEEGLLDIGLLSQPHVTIPPSHLEPYVTHDSAVVRVKGEHFEGDNKSTV